MAYVTDIRVGGTHIADRASKLRASLSTRVAQYRTYRRTLNELRELSARELSDIGIGTGDIRRIALTSAYE